jgi:hypothetical protein
MDLASAPNVSSLVDGMASTKLVGTAQQDQTATSPSFIYSSVPFQDASLNIRLVELFPGQDGDPIYLRLFVVDSVTSQPYEALSYSWGSPSNAVTVSVNGTHLAITPNLADALRCLRPAHGPPRTFWIDAICINQASDTEKAQQVAMMGAIYRTASEVVIFLGAEADDSALVMDYLELADPPLGVTAPAPAHPNPLANARASGTTGSTGCACCALRTPSSRGRTGCASGWCRSTL